MFEQLGGKRAVAMRAWTALLVPLSQQRRFVGRVTTPVRRLVFVCAGNICRSAFGEYAARGAGLPAVSMGLFATEGVPANAVALARARVRGIDLSAHRARRLDAALIRPGDLVLAFEASHADQIESVVQGTGASVRLLGAFDSPLAYHQPDPYGLSEAYFDRCFSRIERCIEGLAQAVELEAAAKGS